MRAHSYCQALRSTSSRPNRASNLIPTSSLAVATVMSTDGRKRKGQFDAKLDGVEPWACTIFAARHALLCLAPAFAPNCRAGARPCDSGRRGRLRPTQYSEEKAHALKALAGLIENIINPTRWQRSVLAGDIRRRLIAARRNAAYLRPHRALSYPMAGKTGLEGRAQASPAFNNQSRRPGGDLGGSW